MGIRCDICKQCIHFDICKYHNEVVNFGKKVFELNEENPSSVERIIDIKCKNYINAYEIMGDNHGNL